MLLVPIREAVQKMERNVHTAFCTVPAPGSVQHTLADTVGCRGVAGLPRVGHLSASGDEVPICYLPEPWVPLGASECQRQLRALPDTKN